MTNWQEYTYVVNGNTPSPQEPDSDFDGLKDGEEWPAYAYRDITIELNPINPDTDGDGLIDGPDDIHVGGRLVYPNGVVRGGKYLADNHPGLSDADPYIIESSSSQITKYDDFNDGWEKKYSKYGGSTALYEWTWSNYWDQSSERDSDNDGLTDHEEETLGTDPHDNDMDNDGLLDKEDHAINGINSIDMDSDGLVDGYDGYISKTEYPEGVDGDGDGWVDGEKGLGTMPDYYDTDGDFLEDGWEVKYGLDPLTSNRILTGTTFNTTKIMGQSLDWIVPGKIGNALQLSSLPHTIDQSSNEFNLPTTDGYLSLAFWVNTGSGTGDIWTKLNADSSSGYGVRLRNKKLQTFIKSGGSESKVERELPVNKWVAVIVEFQIDSNSTDISLAYRYDSQWYDESSTYPFHVVIPPTSDMVKIGGGSTCDLKIDYLCFSRNRLITDSLKDSFWNEGKGTESFSLAKYGWTMNESSLKETVLYISEAKSNSYPLNLVNTTLINGMNGMSSGFAFNGINDYISLDTTKTQVVSNLSKFSLGGWFKFNTNSSRNEGLLVSKNAGVVTSGLARTAAGALNVRIGGQDFIGPMINNQNWHFVMAVFDGSKVSAERLAIYVDNQQAVNCSTAQSLVSLTEMQIGGNDAVGGSGLFQYFSGNMDNVMLFNDALMSSEVQSLYTKGIEGDEKIEQSSLVAQYKMDQRDTSNKINNSSGFGHTDSDGDGIDDFEEQRHGSNPKDADSDKDGMSDKEELGQGTDPTSDKNKRTVEITLEIGDHSGSHSEKYKLQCGNRSHQSRSFGIVEKASYLCQIGDRYCISIKHLANDKNAKCDPRPDYDYTANLYVTGALPEGVVAYVEDPDGILKEHACPDKNKEKGFYAKGKKAWLVITEGTIPERDGISPLSSIDPNNVQRTGLDCKGGEPISANNGEFTLDTRDFTLSGRALSVIFERHYCGKQSGESPFGYGWDMNYNQKLYRQKNQAGQLEFIVMFDGNHGRKKYVVDSQNISRLNPVTPDGSYMEIQSNDTVRIVYQNGGSKGFDVSDMLSYIKDKYGNQISFVYTFVNGNRLLEIITDDLGRDIALSYNDRGLLKEVKDFTGRSWIYSYDDTRNWLRQVTMPGTPEYPAGLTTTYSYQGEETPETDDDKPWIKTVKDPENQTYIDNTYDSEGWVIDQVYGDKHFTFSYDPWHNMFTEMDRNNVTTIKYYDDYGSTLAEGILASTPQKRSGDPFCYLTQYSYDTNRRLIQTVSPSGSTVDLAYDDYGNLLTLTETGYNADYSISARSTSYEYTGIDHYNLVRSATDFAGNKVLYEYDFDQPGYGTQIGNLMKITYPAVMTPDDMQQPEVTFKYNTDGQLKEINSPDNVKTILKYYEEALVAHWTMDDNAESNLVTDQSGKGNHGASIRNTSLMHNTNYNHVNGTLYFDGNDWITVSNSPFSIGNHDFTITGWFKPASLNNKNQCIISNQDITGKGFKIYINSENKLTAYIRDAAGNINSLSARINSDRWNFFALTFDKDYIRLYSSSGDAPVENNRIRDDFGTSQTLLIGGSNSENYMGALDDIRIYQRCLKYDDDIMPICRYGLYYMYLQAYWKADDNSASSAIVDSSNYKHQGTVIRSGSNDESSSIHSVSGKRGQALELDGQNDGIIGSRNDYAESKLRINNSIMISAWIYVDSGLHIGMDKQMIVSKSTSYAFFLTQDAEPKLGFARGTALTEKTSTLPVPLQKWVRVEIVIDYDSNTKIGTYIFLIDGQNAGDGIINEQGVADNQPVTIGCGNESMSNCFDGKIDNVMIFNVPLYSIKDGVLISTQLDAFSLQQRNELNRGRLKSVVVDPEDKKIQVDYEYDLVGNITAVTDPAKKTSEMVYNNLNQLIEMTSALGAKTTFSYNRNKKLSEVKSQAKDTFDPEDPETYQRTEYAYNLLDKLQKVTDATGYSSYLEYDNNDNVKTVIDPKGAGTTYTGPGTTPLYKTGYEYDERNLLWKETDAQNAVTEYSYDLDGNVKSIKDAKGKYTYYQYDAFGNVSRIRYEMYPGSGNARTESFDYDINGNLIQYTKNPGYSYEQKTTYQYDALGRMVSRKLPNQPTEDYLYDIAGRLVSITPRLEDTSLGSYIKGYWKLDDCADTKTVSDSSGAARNGTAQKNTSALYTPGQYCGAFSFNATDMDYITVPYSAPLSDITGNITLSAWIKPTMIADQNRIIIQTGSGNHWPYKLEISFSDNKLRFYRGNGTTIQGYASTGTLSLNQWVHVAVTVSGWSYAFYINGAPSGSGSFTFWAATQMNDVFIGGAGGNYFNGLMDEVMVLNRALTSSEIQTIYVHSATDKVEYDRIGRPSKTTDLNDCTVGYSYNNNSQVETLTYPDNSTVRYEYDAQNRLEYIKEGEIILARYTYDTLSRRTSVQYNTSRDPGDNPTYESKTTYTYMDSERIGLSPDNQLGNWLAKVANDINNDGTADITFEYGYDKAGNRTTMVTTAAGNQGLHTYNYDNLYQLTSAVYQSNWGWANISNIAYDSVFNRTTYTPASGSATSYTINNYCAVNQYTTIDSTDITYDYNGNLTYGGQYVGAGSYTYVYDAQNRLIEVKDGSTSKFTYTYDTFGRRVSKPKSATDDTVLSFCYAGGRILAEYENGVLARKYIYGPGIDEVICLIDTAAGARYYYFYDGLGSVAALSNANNAIIEAYCYDAFGRTKINTTAGPDGNWLTPDGTPAAASGYGNRFMFTGREYDSETDLYSYRARMYSPALGRFLQPDPIGYADSMNLYQYCGNNPINRIDPHGQMWGWVEKVWDWFWGNAPQEVAEEMVEKAADRLCVNDGDLGTPGESMQAFVKTEGLKEYREQVAKEAAEKLARKKAQEKAAKNIVDNALKKIDPENLKLSKTVEKHLDKITKKGTKARPYGDSRLTMQNIMKAGKPRPDPGGLKGGVRWDVPGTMNGTEGTWQLVIDSETNTVVHFLFAGR
ncbi:MAG: LamG-like jellyroll fold domain-containing protein [Anaerohalosphaeraceae bacterium]